MHGQNHSSCVGGLGRRTLDESRRLVHEVPALGGLGVQCSHRCGSGGGAQMRVSEEVCSTVASVLHELQNTRIAVSQQMLAQGSKTILTPTHLGRGDNSGCSSRPHSSLPEAQLQDGKQTGQRRLGQAQRVPRRHKSSPR